MKKRTWILVMLVLLGVVTFLDRINISVAGSAIMKDLGITPDQWGWILSAFILSYGLMQIPMGALGDKRGHRVTLALIVLWWSAFTIFTGMAGGFAGLLMVRLMFGVGEAGSSPCSTGVISRWFPKDKVGRAQGFVWAASRMGGALTPFIVIPVIASLGWRSAFYILGAVGVIWALVWFLFYRNNPAQMRGISAEELAEAPASKFYASGAVAGKFSTSDEEVVSSAYAATDSGAVSDRSVVSGSDAGAVSDSGVASGSDAGVVSGATAAPVLGAAMKVKIPWGQLLRARQFWLLLSMYFFYAFGSWFFFSWFPTFMELGRGFDKQQLTYAIAAPFIMSMVGNISGGYLTDHLAARYGLKVGRKALGSGALILSALFMFLAAFIPGKLQVFIFLSLCFGVVDLMLPSAWALCIDLGKKYAGAVSGAMNTAGNLGGFVCATIFGYLVSSTGNYNLPLFLIAGMLVISAILFLFIDPTKQILKEE